MQHICNTCGGNCNKRCKCGSVWYCNEDCQRKDFKKHKLLCSNYSKATKSSFRNEIKLEDIITEYCTFFYNTPTPFIDYGIYSGKTNENEKEIWIMNQKIKISRSPLDHYTSQSNKKPMTNEEFYKFYTAGQCGPVSTSFALFMCFLFNNDTTITYNGFKIDSFKAHTGIPPEKSSTIFAYWDSYFPSNPKDRGDNFTILNGNGHGFVSIVLSNKKAYVVDLTCAQFGDMGNTNISRYPIRIQEILNDEFKWYNCTKGIILTVDHLKEILKRKNFDDTDTIRENMNNSFWLLENFMMQQKTYQ